MLFGVAEVGAAGTGAVAGAGGMLYAHGAKAGQHADACAATLAPQAEGRRRAG